MRSCKFAIKINRLLILGLLSAAISFIGAICEPEKFPTFDSVEGEIVQVAEVFDGDTVKLTDGRVIRYIGIDAPEKYEKDYEESKEANKKLVLGKEVKLELDAEKVDRYGRTLAYIFTKETFVNWQLVRDGFAQAVAYPPNLKYQELLFTAGLSPE